MSDARARAWRRVGLIVLAPAIFLAVYGVYAPSQPLINPDSSGYLTFTGQRSGGYPFFLALLKPLIRDLGDYTIAQPLLYAASVLVLGGELMRCLDRPALAVLAQVALLFNPEVNRYHFAIFTKSLFLSTSALFLAAAFAHLRAGGLVSLAAASTLAGCLIAIRPTGLAFLPALVVLVLARRRGARWVLARGLPAALVPVLAVLALESAYYAAHHPGMRHSPAPAHLLAKSAMIEVPEAASAEAASPLWARPESRPLLQALESLAPVRRLVAEAPNQPARCLLGGVYEVHAQLGFAPEERALATEREGPVALLRIAWERLRQNIGGYLWLSVHHLACLWTLGAADVAEQAALRSYIDAHRPLPFEAHVLGGILSARSPPFPALVRWTMLGIAGLLAGCGLALAIVMLRRREPGLLLAAGGLCGLVVHAALILTALTGVGIPRYVLGLWVPMAIGTGLAGLWLWELCASPRLLLRPKPSG